MGKVKAWLMELEERRHEENLEDYEAKMPELCRYRQDARAT